jgi:signal transduction histidine kinase
VLAGGYVEPGTDQGRKLLRGALDRSSDLLTIVNDLLELAKVREGLSNAPWAREVNLNQLLADLFDSLGPAADEQRIRLVPEFEGIAVLDRGVPPDLVFAFHNVIDNGIKYSNEDGTVRVRLSVDDHVASVTVADDGIGIPPEFLDQVFLEFVRAPNARRHTIHGTGLGMAVVRDVIHAHGGTVAVDSDLGRGTTVVIRLPLHHGSANGADEDVSFR